MDTDIRKEENVEAKTDFFRTAEYIVSNKNNKPKANSR